MFVPAKIGSWLLRLAAIACIAVACGSTSTTIEQSWRTPDTRMGDLRNVVTLCICRDGTLRRNAEDALASRLRGAGVRATPAYAVLAEPDLQDREGAKAKLAAAGFDGVVAMRLVSSEQELEYIPGSFDNYWGPSWAMAYDPSYLHSELVVRIETSAYSLVNRQLVWSALSRTVDPDDADDLLGEISKVAAKEMQKQGIVAGSARPGGA